jgi:hypothetical protein
LRSERLNPLDSLLVGLLEYSAGHPVQSLQVLSLMSWIPPEIVPSQVDPAFNFGLEELLGHASVALFVVIFVEFVPVLEHIILGF